MSYREEDILHEDGDYFVIRVKHGVEVYQTRGCASYRCASINLGSTAHNLYRAVEEIARHRSRSLTARLNARPVDKREVVEG